MDNKKHFNGNDGMRGASDDLIFDDILSANSGNFSKTKNKLKNLNEMSNAPVTQKKAKLDFNEPFVDFSPVNEDAWDNVGEDFADTIRRNINSSSNAKEKNVFKRILFSIFPHKGDTKKDVAGKLVRMTTYVVICCSLAYVGKYVVDSMAAQNPPPIAEITTDDTGNKVDPRDKYPGIVFPEGLLDEYVDLYAINQDFVGYLWVDCLNGRKIEEIIVKSQDPNDPNYYLKHNLYKAYSDFGIPFLDYSSDKDLSVNTVIHGHNMNDGSHFAMLEDYLSVEAFKNSQIITYSTQSKIHKFKIYAVMITNGEMKSDNNYLFNYLVPDFSGEASFKSFMKVIDQKKLYTTGVDVKYGDKLLMLSTCIEFVNNERVYKYSKMTARLVVVGRLIREGESEEVDLSKVAINENPRYPQYWYDKRKQKGYENPEIWNP